MTQKFHKIKERIRTIWTGIEKEDWQDITLKNYG